MAAPVIFSSTSVLGFIQWQTWEYGAFATNTPTSWACPGLPPGMSIDATTGLISGFSTAPGVWVCPLSATNGSGTSAAYVLTIGIVPALYAPTECPALVIDLDTGHVSSPNGSRTSAKSADGPLLWVKEGDTLPLMVRFYNGDVWVNVTLSSLVLAVKQFEPDGKLVTGGGGVLDTDFAKFGTDDTSYFVMVTDFSGASLAGALSDYEADAGTFFYALAEIEYRSANTFTVGADPLIRTTRSFLIGIERDLQNNA